MNKKGKNSLAQLASPMKKGGVGVDESCRREKSVMQSEGNILSRGCWHLLLRLPPQLPFPLFLSFALWQNIPATSRAGKQCDPVWV
ncbi:hypothetical protein CEXT_367031 [Caerostris extrusa]|uniref:Uncharacterized protein n=1 Tax=Caerostris extrusa TaxID=172846 RepID=A0AAV4NKZ1_CAEEX|nr:hypothetical protein CEXT_367031 [Caerostris extrusa]